LRLDPTPLQRAYIADLPREQIGTLTPEQLLDASVMLFTMLRISPSYELARKMSLGPLTKDEYGQLPSDFDEVLRTFERFGDVQQAIFAEWWRYRAVKVLTSPRQPTARFLELIGAGETDPARSLDAVKWHFDAERKEDGEPVSLLLSVPIGLERRAILDQVEQILDTWEAQATAKVPARWGSELFAPPPRPLNADWMSNSGAKRNRTRLRALDSLIVRALHPHLDNWEVQCRLTPKDRAAIDASDAKRDGRKGPTVTADQRELESRLLRDIRSTKILVENAARGRFPSTSNVPQVQFHPSEVGNRLRGAIAWEDALQDYRSRRVTRLSGRRTIPRCPIRRCIQDYL
jgi:hypothetical protein